MVYTIIFSEYASKQLKKLDKDIQIRMKKSLRRCMIRPHAHVEKIVSSPYFKLRAGDYRIIMRIENKILKILVVKIDHRKKIYKTK
jgi:mRNA interferase RelE/StbE